MRAQADSEYLGFMANHCPLLAGLKNGKSCLIQNNDQMSTSNQVVQKSLRKMLQCFYSLNQPSSMLLSGVQNVYIISLSRLTEFDESISILSKISCQQECEKVNYTFFIPIQILKITAIAVSIINLCE